MSNYQKPAPDPHKVLTDLAEVIATSFKQRITLIVESSGGLEGSTTVIDRRITLAAAKESSDDL
jgi:hypothetical protein